MNLLYCGDRNIEDGLIISVLSLLKNVKEQLNITVLTMSLRTEEKQYEALPEDTIRFLDDYVKKADCNNSVRLIDMTESFVQELPRANIDTRFTPYCMLRLFCDKIEDMPERILYLDNDVICRRDFHEFYEQDMEGHELAGVLDHYGKWFFHTRIFPFDYMNSGVLLLNLKMIRKTGLFEKCRKMCMDKKMFMPDQSAINKLALTKKICARKYNEQRRLRSNTVFQHFTTSFRFFPWVHTLTVKPWQIERLHKELKLFEYDDILNEYSAIMTKWKGQIS